MHQFREYFDAFLLAGQDSVQLFLNPFNRIGRALHQLNFSIMNRVFLLLRVEHFASVLWRGAEFTERHDH